MAIPYRSSEIAVSFREPMFVITGSGNDPVGAVAVEVGHWIGRDTAGRKLFDRHDGS